MGGIAALQSRYVRYVDQMKIRVLHSLDLDHLSHLRLSSHVFTHHIGSGPIRFADSLHAQGQASGIFIHVAINAES